MLTNDGFWHLAEWIEIRDSLVSRLELKKAESEFIMAKTVPCKICNHQVAKKANHCPSCGAKEPGLNLKDTLIGFAALVVIIVAVSLWINH